MLPCVCLVIDHRKRQNVARTSVTLGYDLGFYARRLIRAAPSSTITLHMNVVPRSTMNTNGETEN